LSDIGLLYERHGGRILNRDSVGELYPENDLWSLVLSVDATPTFLGGLSKI